MFFVFPSRPLPLTPRAGYLTGNQNHLPPPASGKCKACKAGGDGLLACSFCTAVYHNSEACLGEAWVANEALAKSASFPWACPACFKKGVTAVQRAALKPTGQRAAGAKKSRKKRAKKK